MTRLTGRVLISTMMELSILASGIRTISMGRDWRPGLMEPDTKGNIREGKSMAKENLTGLISLAMMENS